MGSAGVQAAGRTAKLKTLNSKPLTLQTPLHASDHLPTQFSLSQ